MACQDVDTQTNQAIIKKYDCKGTFHLYCLTLSSGQMMSPGPLAHWIGKCVPDSWPAVCARQHEAPCHFLLQLSLAAALPQICLWVPGQAKLFAQFAKDRFTAAMSACGVGCKGTFQLHSTRLHPFPHMASARVLSSHFASGPQSKSCDLAPQFCLSANVILLAQDDAGALQHVLSQQGIPVRVLRDRSSNSLFDRWHKAWTWYCDSCPPCAGKPARV